MGAHGCGRGFKGPRSLSRLTGRLMHRWADADPGVVSWAARGAGGCGTGAERGSVSAPAATMYCNF